MKIWYVSFRYGFDWVEMLTEPGFVTPPISCFRHAPLCDTWASDVSVGMKVIRMKNVAKQG